MMVVVAVPTIPVRRHLHAELEAAWRRHSCQPVELIFSEAGSSWGDGLNDVWAQVADSLPDIFLCGSDDMQPEDDNWLPPLARELAEGRFPAPTVIDPRFTNYGGHTELVEDGTPSPMSSFPVLAGAWCDLLFPLPAGLHYFTDNYLAVALAEMGIPCVAVPSSRIRHTWAEPGRGAGAGSEWARMTLDSVSYTAALAAIGVDRASLPEGVRGPLA